MKYKRALIAGGCLWAALTVCLWPYHQQLLPVAASRQLSDADIAAELSGVSAQAPLSLLTEPDDTAEPVMQAIQTAHQSVDLVIYELEDPQVEQALADAQSRGIAVRVMLDNLDSFGNYPNRAAFGFLQAHAVPVEWAPSSLAITHQKTLIIDGTQAFIMTFNLSPQYYTSSRDFAVVDAGPKDVAAIKAVFDADWSGQTTSTDTASDLVWSPGSANTLVALINSATSSLDIYNEEMADSRIENALQAAAARGVHVRVNMTYATSWKKALQSLATSGVEVRTYASSAKFYIHAKVIIADNAEAFIGSENFSTQSLDLNRELGILLKRPDVIQSLEATFNKDWAGSRPFDN
jgi:phosphatidylserine/phosphatidylglycerophosphate/cardiolipin synthase-like enzyme